MSSRACLLPLSALVLAILLMARPARGQGGTEIFLAPLETVEGALQVGTPVNITERPGYDNQPSFTPDGKSILFTAILEDGQADTHRYDLDRGQVVHLIQTPESEYSPSITPGGALNVVRVEADSTQRLWEFFPEGKERVPVLPHQTGIGYYAWGDDDAIALFVLGEPHSLYLASALYDTATVIAGDIGRSLQRIPGRDAISFLQHEPDDTWTVSELDVGSQDVRSWGSALGDSQDLCWTPDGVMLMGRANELYGRRPEQEQWTLVATFEEPALQELSRLAVSPDGRWLVLVSGEPEPANHD